MKSFRQFLLEKKLLDRSKEFLNSMDEIRKLAKKFTSEEYSRHQLNWYDDWGDWSKENRIDSSDYRKLRVLVNSFINELILYIDNILNYGDGTYAKNLEEIRDIAFKLNKPDTNKLYLDQYAEKLINLVNNYKAKLEKAFKEYVNYQYMMGRENPEYEGIEYTNYKVKNTDWNIIYGVVYRTKNEGNAGKSNQKIQKVLKETIDFLNNPLVPWLNKHLNYIINEPINIIIAEDISDAGTFGQAFKKGNTEISQTKYAIKLEAGFSHNQVISTLIHEIGHIIHFKLWEIPGREKEWNDFVQNNKIPLTDEVKREFINHFHKSIEKTFKRSDIEVDNTYKDEEANYNTIIKTLLELIVDDVYDNTNDLNVYQLLADVSYLKKNPKENYIAFQYEISLSDKKRIIDHKDTNTLFKLITDKIRKTKSIVSSTLTSYANTNSLEYFAEMFREFFYSRLDDVNAEFFKGYIGYR